MKTSEIISEPINWLGTAANILFTPIKFGWEVLSESMSLVGHGIQVVEATIINAAGSVLEDVVGKAEPTLDALLDWVKANPVISTIVDVFAEVTTLVLGIFGFEVPSFSGFGCFGM